MTVKGFAVRSTNCAGTDFFYTGRAGSGFVSDNPSDAFLYQSPLGARTKAASFNRVLANWRFAAVAVTDAGIVPVSDVVIA